MVIVVVFAGILGGLVSGGAALFALELGWIATIGAFYGGAFGSIGLVSLRVALLGGNRGRDTRAAEPSVAEAG